MPPIRAVLTTWFAPAAAAVSLVVALVVSRLDFRTAGITLGVAISVGGLCWMVHILLAPAPQPFVARRLGRSALQLALHLSPVALLSIAYPLSSGRIGAADIGGTPLFLVLLASSLTVPWLSQATCLPVYRLLGSLISDRDPGAVRRRFAEVWPAAFVKTAPVLLVFAVVLEVAVRWSVEAVAAYLVLCVLHLAFAQSLVPGNVCRQRWLWALAWAVYAAALFAAPTLWYLPPLLGLLTQVVPMRLELARVIRPDRLDNTDLAVDVVRGLLLGSVLWSDKFLLFIRLDGHFPVTVIFTAMLPAVLAYNQYFVQVAPRFDDHVDAVRHAIESESSHDLEHRTGALARSIRSGLGRTGLIGAVLVVALTFGATLVTPGSAVLLSVVAVTSWLFMMTTILCYKLDYAGNRLEAQLLSGAHLAAAAIVFSSTSSVVELYVWLGVAELAVCAAALYACLRHWRAAEYVLFWRQATAW